MVVARFRLFELRPIPFDSSAANVVAFVWVGGVVRAVVYLRVSLVVGVT